jgi:hypothetical protein
VDRDRIQYVKREVGPCRPCTLDVVSQQKRHSIHVVMDARVLEDSMVGE